MRLLLRSWRSARATSAPKWSSAGVTMTAARLNGSRPRGYCSARKGGKAPDTGVQATKEKRSDAVGRDAGSVREAGLRANRGSVRGSV